MTEELSGLRKLYPGMLCQGAKQDWVKITAEELMEELLEELPLLQGRRRRYLFRRGMHAPA